MNRYVSALYQDLLSQVNEVLMQEWHPIGAPVPDDEYDAYARRLTSMLFHDCSMTDLLDYLAKSERVILGETSEDEGRRARVAGSLKKLRARGHR